MQEGLALKQNLLAIGQFKDQQSKPTHSPSVLHLHAGLVVLPEEEGVVLGVLLTMADGNLEGGQT